MTNPITLDMLVAAVRQTSEAVRKAEELAAQLTDAASEADAAASAALEDAVLSAHLSNELTITADMYDALSWDMGEVMWEAFARHGYASYSEDEERLVATSPEGEKVVASFFDRVQAFEDQRNHR